MFSTNWDILEESGTVSDAECDTDEADDDSINHEADVEASTFLI